MSVPDPISDATADDAWPEVKKKFEYHSSEFKIFMDSIESFFNLHPSMMHEGRSVVHSTKKRIKNLDHLKEKIIRKSSGGRSINAENLFEEVTDIAGVRILLLFQRNFDLIDNSIRQKVVSGDWYLNERPKAFTWDPEARDYFSKFDLEVGMRETLYTSVHYLIKPRKDSFICCEVQVRTLFEEIWGEIDHMINYPHPTESISCKEQLMVLSKIVGAGSRLVDSLQRVMPKNGVVPS